VLSRHFAGFGRLILKIWPCLQRMWMALLAWCGDHEDDGDDDVDDYCAMQVSDSSDSPGRERIVISAGWDHMVKEWDVCALPPYKPSLTPPPSSALCTIFPFFLRCYRATAALFATVPP
jgi:hypothetical protein